jgi:hypothetical protein
VHNLVGGLKVGETQFKYFTENIKQLSEKQELDRDRMVQLESDLRITRKELETLNAWAQMAGYGGLGEKSLPNIQKVVA